MKRFIFLIIFIFSFLFNACQDISQYGMLSPPPEFDMAWRYGEFVDTTIFAYSDSFIVNDRANTQYQSKISIGSYEGFSSSFLINFLRIPDTSFGMDSVYLTLYPAGIFGSGNDPLQIGVYEVETEWDVTANTKDEWHNPQDIRLITIISASANDSVAIKIPIDDPELIERWQKAGDDNFGLYLKALNDPQFILELNAISPSSVTPREWPKLTYKKTINDTITIPDSLNVGYNVAIYNYDRIGNENVYEVAQEKKDLLVSSGIAAQSILQFDIKNTLPKNALIHKTNLTIYVNDNNIIDESEGNILDNPNHGGNFYVRLIKDMETMEIDSTFNNSGGFIFNNYLTQNEDVLEFSAGEQTKFGKAVIQSYVNGDLDFEGFFIEYRQEGIDVSVKRLYGINQQEFIPTLQIQYFRIDHPGM